MNVSEHPLYSTWSGMKDRCYNPNNKEYNHYGGRGIRVCKRWFDNPQAFILDMGNRPDGTTLDRINNRGNYTPLNCQWATPEEQNRNKRANRKSSTRVKGVSACQLVSGKRYMAHIKVEGKSIGLGRYKTINEARKVRKQAELKYWGRTWSI